MSDSPTERRRPWPPHPDQKPTSSASAAASPDGSSPLRSWVNRHRVLTVVLGAILTVAVLAAIGSALPHHKGSGSDVGAIVSALHSTTPKPPQITGRISGSFQDPSLCFACDNYLVNHVHPDDIWCGWQGKHVLMHLRFRSDAVVPLTVIWHPSFVITGGGEFGAGITSVRSLNLKAHATRVAEAIDAPKGIPVGSPIGQCIPAFADVSKD